MRTPHPRDPRTTGALLLGQLILCAAAAGALLGVSPMLASANVDAMFVWALALTLHSLATLRFVDHAVDFLNLDCPRCAESFHGYPEKLPRLSRKQCANCGAEFGTATAAR